MRHFTVDKQEGKPFYRQIRDYLLAEIDEGRLQPGQRIPSVNEFSQQTGVSKTTVLQAIRELHQRGRLYSVVGKGIYVSKNRKLEPDVGSVWGFTETFQAGGYRTSSQLIHSGRIKADSSGAQALQVPQGTWLFRLERTRLLNEHPVGVETAHLVEAEFPGLDQYDWNVESLYAVLKKRFGMKPVCGLNYIEAGLANEANAQLLSVPKNTAVLVTERISCLANHHPIEYVRAFYRADLMRLKVEMTTEGTLNLTSRISQIQ